MSPGEDAVVTLTVEEIEESGAPPGSPAVDAFTRRHYQAKDQPKHLKVARRVPNIFRDVPEYFLGFVYDIDDVGSADEPRWLVKMEGLLEDWFVKVWFGELRSRGADRLFEIFNSTAEFADIFFGLGSAEMELIWDIHRYFVRRTMQADDPAPTSIIEVFLKPDDWIRKNLRGAHWYRFVLRGSQPYSEPADDKAVPDGQVLYGALALDFEQDPLPVWRNLLRLEHDGLLDRVLKSLHLPQAAPGAAGATPMAVSGASGTPPSGTPSSGAPPSGAQGTPAAAAADPPPDPEPGSSRSFLRRSAASLQRRASDLLETIQSTFDPDIFCRPPLALAGVPGAFPSMPPDAPPSRNLTRPVLYHGRPAAALAPLVQVVNPMVPAVPAVAGAQQPFVGVLNVGTGNLNALFDSQGRIVCYFDFGFPPFGQAQTPPVLQYANCLHNDPLMVLSHWDWDHYSMSRRVRSSWDMRWIAPQQHVGSAATQQVYGRVVNSPQGGELYVWTADPAVAAPGFPPQRHLRLAWGFIERGIVRNQLGHTAEALNDGGLVMYVCVGSAGAAAVPAAGVNLPLAPLNARGAAPPVGAAGTAGRAAAAAAQARQFSQLVQAVAQTAEQASAQYGGAAPLPVWFARAAAAACGALLASNAIGVWQDAFRAISESGLLAGAAAGDVAAILAGGMVPAINYVNLNGAIGAHARASIAIARVAFYAAPAAGPWPLALVTAQAGCATVAFPAGLALAFVVPAVNPATAAAVAAFHADEQIEIVAGAASAASAEAATAAAQAVALLPADCADAAAGAVGALIGSNGAAGWAGTLEALQTAGARGNAVSQASVQFAGVVGPAATMAAQVNTWGAPIFGGAAAGPLVEGLAAAAATVDSAVAAFASSAAIAAAPALPVGPGNLEQAAAEAGVPPIAAGGAAGPAAIQAAQATNQSLLAREVAAAGRAAAREVFLAGGFAAARMPLQTAPLPAAPGPAALPGVPAGPGAAAIAGPAAGGANLLANRVAGNAPVHGNERFILLTGDVSLLFVPTQSAGAGLWPRVVGMTPVHHGALTCITTADTASYWPFAPGSPCAAAGAAAGVAGAAAINKAATAAAAYWAAEAGRHLNREPLSGAITLAEIGAAAGAVALAATSNAALVAIGGALAAGPAAVAAAHYLAGVVPVIVGAGPTITLTPHRLSGALLAAIAARRLQQTGVAAGYVVNLADIQACATQLGLGAQPAVSAGIWPATLAWAVSMVMNNIPALALLPGPVVAPLAAEILDAFLAVLFVCALADTRAALAAGPAVLSTAASTAARTTATQLVNAYNVQTVAPAMALGWQLPAPMFWPGPLAGIAPNAFTSVPAAAIEIAIESTIAGNMPAAVRMSAAAARVWDLARSETIAYSYGVRNTPGNYRHYFSGVNNRHPSPRAVRQYAGRGWTRRASTSVNAWQGAQPDPWTVGPLAPGGAGSPNFVPGGHIALGWDTVNQQPLLAGAIDRRPCPLCGNMHFTCP